MNHRMSTFSIKKATFTDVRDALTDGINDFRHTAFYGLFFGGFYALGGLVILYSVFVLGMMWLVYPLLIGFALIGPFAATGLYEISRRRETHTSFNWKGILGVIWLQRRRELGWMAFVMLFVFWIWIYQIRTLVAVFFGFSGFADFAGFLETVLTTETGLVFLFVGHAVGAMISFSLFALTVISCPLLLDKDVDFVTAMVSSVRAVVKSPVVMLSWGGLVIVSVILAAIPAFLGFLFILPILGHATWHLYRKIVVHQA